MIFRIRSKIHSSIISIHINSNGRFGTFHAPCSICETPEMSVKHSLFRLPFYKTLTFKCIQPLFPFSTALTGFFCPASPPARGEAGQFHRKLLLCATDLSV